MESKISFEGYSVISLIATHLPFVEMLTPRQYNSEYYFALLYAGFDNRLKRPQVIDAPNDYKLRKTYIACALMYRGSLTHLTISDYLEYEQGKGGGQHYMDRKLAQYHLLFDELHNFTQLNKLEIQKT